MKPLQVTDYPLKNLVPYENNAKKHTPAQIADIQRSIELYGMNDPIQAWHNSKGDAVILAGHGRYEALTRMGREKAPVIFLDGLSEDQARAYSLVHNQLNLETGFDLDMLAQELSSIPEDLLDGFTFPVDTDYIDLTDERMSEFLGEMRDKENKRLEEDMTNDHESQNGDHNVDMPKVRVKCPNCNEIFEVNNATVLS